VVTFVQISHRRDAIDGMIAAITKIYGTDPDARNPDPLTREAGAMNNWLVETLLQGP
jgi:hypothetical protein